MGSESYAFRSLIPQIIVRLAANHPISPTKET